MTKDEVVQTLRKYFESLFPKVCPNCNRRYATLPEYILGTRRIGLPVAYDAEIGNWKNRKLIGSVVSVNCQCGTTLSLTTKKMDYHLRLELLNWVVTETRKQNMKPAEFLENIRDEIRKLALGDPN